MPRCKHCGRDKDEAYQAVSSTCAPPFETRTHEWDNEVSISERIALREERLDYLEGRINELSDTGEMLELKLILREIVRNLR